MDDIMLWLDGGHAPGMRSLSVVATQEPLGHLWVEFVWETDDITFPLGLRRMEGVYLYIPVALCLCLLRVP